MKIRCPRCAQSYDVESEHIGQSLTCSGCGVVFEIVNPNLTPCEDCFTLISKRARSCPHCGACLTDSPAAVSKPEGSSVEKTLKVCRPSAFYFLPLIALGILLSLVVVGLLILAYCWVQVSRTRYTITNKRVIRESGWLSKTRSEIWIKDMRGAALRQSFFERLGGIGTLEIGTAATAGVEMQLLGIAEPQQVVDLINAQRR